jgi:hypothetical protein
MTTARRATPLALSILACGSTSSHIALGMPVLLKPSTVMNIPQKKINSEYDTCKYHETTQIYFGCCYERIKNYSLRTLIPVSNMIT